MKEYLLGLIGILIIFTSSPLAAQDFSQIHVGILAPYIVFGGNDFDGTHFFDTGSELIYVPKMDSKFGWGLVVGASQGENWDMELYYMHSNHRATFLDFADKAYIDAIGINNRFYFLPPGFVRAYGNLGIDITFLKVSNGSISKSAPYTEGDSHFTGVGICGGVGLSINPLKAVSLFGGAEIRWNLFGKAKGVGGESNELESLTSLAICFRTGLLVRFSL